LIDDRHDAGRADSGGTGTKNASGRGIARARVCAPLDGRTRDMWRSFARMFETACSTFTRR
jgi:hypothetical protein